MIFRRHWILYLVSLHILIMGIVAFLFWETHRLWIVVAEVTLFATLSIGLWLTSLHSRYEDLTEIGADFIREGDFSHLFHTSVHPDINKFVVLYNSIITSLREERLLKQEQEKLLDMVIESAPSGLITLGSDGVVDIVNAAALEMFELGPDRVNGRRLEKLESELARRLATLPMNRSVVISLPGPRKIRAEHAGYFREAAQRSLFILTEMTKELWTSERKVYEQVIRTFSHEVNNTVTAANSILKSVSAYASQLQEEDREEYTDALNVVIDRMVSLNAFMRSYADIIKLPGAVRVPVDLGETLQSLKRLFLAECDERKIGFELDVDNNLPEVSLDSDLFERAMINVIRNSIESVERDGGVVVRAKSRPGGSVDITVEDNGPGIDEAIEPELFAPFTTNKAEGQGLGLVLVKEILSRHKFSFSLRSYDDGWTRFVIRIPRDVPGR